jgi:hypothetical protein
MKSETRWSIIGWIFLVAVLAFIFTMISLPKEEYEEWCGCWKEDGITHCCFQALTDDLYYVNTTVISAVREDEEDIDIWSVRPIRHIRYGSEQEEFIMRSGYFDICQKQRDYLYCAKIKEDELWLYQCDKTNVCRGELVSQDKEITIGWDSVEIDASSLYYYNVTVS